MAIFQTSVLKKFLKQQNDAVISTAYKKFVKYFHDPVIQQNIRESKEEQFQAKFLDELFVQIFGYTLSPKKNFNLTTEFKNIKNSRKADGAILKDDKAVAVIELKSTKTKDLESIRQQAFDYKANQPGCVYVITSNFEKIRFYINNAVDFEEFDLFNLSEDRFKLMYLCLEQDHLLNDLPLKIKEASILEEEEITKKFYADYSLFKRELYRDLVKRNMRNDVFRNVLASEESEVRADKNIKLTLFKKSQKLLDRFLFIFFGEDRGLLPPNSIPKILEQWESLKDLDAYAPLYERYQKYFSYLNEGWKGKDYEIFAYNGGLFKPDPILDSVLVDDELLFKHTSILTKYDFESQVDVNILGHIFENSLNEIESVNAEIEGVAFDKQKTKRKKDGVFYTPKYITKYIVDNTIGKLCEEKRVELGVLEEEYLKGRKNRPKTTIAKLDEQLNQYREWLLGLTICDPACGSGAFLNQALEFLITEHRWIDEMHAKLLGGAIVFQDVENSILENNIYGVDLNDESVEIAKLSLWLRTAQKGRKLTSLNNNIKCGNSLIDSKSVAGDKAFDWQKEFPEVFEKGGFDVVIGNPPWGAKLKKEELTYIKKQHKDIIVRMVDSFMFFIDKSINMIKHEGNLGLIIPDVILYQKDNEKLRLKILQNTNLTHALNVGDGIFEQVARPSSIIIAKKTKQKESTIVGNFDKRFDSDFFSIKTEKVNSNLFLTIPNSMFATKNISGYALLNRLSKIKLKDFIDQDGIQRGISPDLKDAFIVSKSVIKQKNLEDSKIHKTVTGGVDVKRYVIPDKDKYILYIGKNDEQDQIKNIINHISEFKDRITCTEVKQGKHPFYSLHRTRDEKIFNKDEKIIGVITGDKIITAVDDKKIYPTDGLYLFSIATGGSNKSISTVLNSKLLTYLYRLISSESNRTMAQVKPVLVSELPMIRLNSNTIVKLESFYDNLVDKYFKLINEIEKLSNYIVQKFSVGLTKKMKSWYNLDFSDFIKELNKAIKKAGGEKLSKMDEMEWMEVFEAKKKVALELKAEIDKVDKEIDQLVYELYGLSEEEIEIVENS